ncbi:hypothetical protein [Novosphingobium sp. FKTRR1]|uniref:hypothetical protein n=1 Tax=Novosphingobium sp. FKTRR1 TaxID=2879118 RepID=UPI001CF09E1C|nr:hypothetical protein [Novosphingobium sp. FKTRR1]
MMPQLDDAIVAMVGLQRKMQQISAVSLGAERRSNAASVGVETTKGAIRLGTH